LSVRVSGLDDVQRMLEGIRERTAEPRPALAQWAATMRDVVLDAAAAKTTPEGQPWRPRKTVTRVGNRVVARKQSRASGQLGDVSGRMLASVRTSIGARAVIVEVGAPYARFFSSGTRYQPARRLLPTSSRGPYGEALAGFVRGLADYAVSGRVR
jgi:hypothetical protein